MYYGGQKTQIFETLPEFLDLFWFSEPKNPEYKSNATRIRASGFGYFRVPAPKKAKP